MSRDERDAIYPTAFATRSTPAQSRSSEHPPIFLAGYDPLGNLLRKILIDKIQNLSYLVNQANAKDSELLQVSISRLASPNEAGGTRRL